MLYFMSMYIENNNMNNIKNNNQVIYIIPLLIQSHMINIKLNVMNVI